MYGTAIAIGFAFGLFGFWRVVSPQLALIAAHPHSTAGAKDWLRKAFGHDHPIPKARRRTRRAPHRGE